VSKILISRKDNSTRVSLDVDFATEAFADAFLAAKATQRMRQVNKAIRAVAQRQPDKTRKRLGELQPLLPRQVREALRKAAAAEHITSAALVKRWLEHYVDFEAGRRRRNKQKQRRPVKLADFRESGRALLKDDDRIRFTFDAGSENAKLAIERLIKATGVTISGFFTALVLRQCNELGHDPSGSL
jgi:hypothetical protein